jgi:carbon monoxide dehydrogenase subunit G
VILDQRAIVPGDAAVVWDFLMDVPVMSRCVPGVETVEEREPDTFYGTLKVRVGPITVRLEGKVTVIERDRDTWRASMRIDAADRKLKGALDATSTLRLEPRDDGTTELHVHTNAVILGRLGEFGQPIMRRKAEQIMSEFAENMRVAITARGQSADAAPIP